MRFVVTVVAFTGLLVTASLTSTAQARSSSFSGTIEKVWEDGFRLKTEEHSLKVDSWDVFGDNTSVNLSEGDQVTVDGEFDGGEFDAFSIIKEDNVKFCTQDTIQ
ncbi:hypothetical protein [Mastigocoleus testarum]|uniref:DUF5666 domain-containing protein n=1 Tax=Mastigocoleus testarum BC008 TaxID=371196 RepID=A0A0V7ZES7_9CYAN|nr:hypothetical protein [Mastigocoleus testarum]KST63061.1 hypothetical protein BC008_12145 [Mastigocoleus testarum BC008]KST69080.1 hypothetical protein BC008_34750 [Mastigocoleus testarum BC008]